MATVAQVVSQAQAAAGEFQGPIDIGTAIQNPSAALSKSILDMGNKQAAIMDEAAKEIGESPALANTLVALQNATSSLNQTAAHMVDAVTIVNKVNDLLGYGSAAVSALQKVTS